MQKLTTMLMILLMACLLAIPLLASDGGGGTPALTLDDVAFMLDAVPDAAPRQMQALPDIDAPTIGEPIESGGGWLNDLFKGGILFTIAGWAREKLNTKRLHKLYAALFEGGQFVVAGTTFMATGKRCDYELAMKEAKDVVVVSKAVWRELTELKQKNKDHA